MNIDMDEAIDFWLDAREAWINGRQKSSLDKMNFATDVLYVAFVGDSASDLMVGDAFFNFHKLLAEEHDKGILQRAKLHPTPTMVGHA